MQVQYDPWLRFRTRPALPDSCGGFAEWQHRSRPGTPDAAPRVWRVGATGASLDASAPACFPRPIPSVLPGLVPSTSRFKGAASSWPDRAHVYRAKSMPLVRQSRVNASLAIDVGRPERSLVARQFVCGGPKAITLLLCEGSQGTDRQGYQRDLVKTWRMSPAGPRGAIRQSVGGVPWETTSRSAI